MPDLTIPKEYGDTLPWTEDIMDGIKSAIETWANTTKLDSTNIQTGGISADNLATNAVTSTKISAAAVTSAKIDDSAVTGVKLNSNVVDNSTLQYTSSQLSVKDGGITQAKRAALGHQVSSSSDNSASQSSSYADVTGLSISITTTGRPVFVGLQSDGTTEECWIGTFSPSTNATGWIKLMRDSTDVAFSKLSSGAGETLFVPTSSFWHVDTPTAGTYTYKIQYKTVDSSRRTYVTKAKLIAFEL